MKASELLLNAGKSFNRVFVDLSAAWCSHDHVSKPLLGHILSMGIGASVITMSWDTAIWWAFSIGLLVLITGLYAHPPQKVNIRPFN